MNKESLREIQKVFQAMVEGEEVPTGIFKTPAQADLTERSQVYRYAYSARMIESLEDDFPQVGLVLGAPAFHQVLTDYVRQIPSHSWSLGEYSGDFPDFLKHHPSTEGREEIYSLARLEWQKILCFLGPSPSPFDFSQLNTWNESQWERATLSLNRSLILFETRWPLHDMELMRNPPRPAKESTLVGIYQNLEREVLEYPFSAAEEVLLSEVMKQIPMSLIGEQLRDSDFTEDQVSGIVAKWTQKGLIESVSDEI